MLGARPPVSYEVLVKSLSATSGNKTCHFAKLFGNTVIDFF
jgi:hypothetical protein